MVLTNKGALTALTGCPKSGYIIGCMKSLYTKQQSYESVTIIVKIESYDNRMFIQISNASHAKIALWPDANILRESSFLQSLKWLIVSGFYLTPN